MARYTSSLVMGSASGGTANMLPSPPSAATAAFLNPRRANSDKALPRLMRFRSASARATARTSSSMVTVVRISASSHRSIDCQSRQREIDAVDAAALEPARVRAWNLDILAAIRMLRKYLDRRASRPWGKPGRKTP